MSFLFKIDEIENINTNTQIEVKTGDLWQLGEHRLLCGDCTIKENIDLLMNGNKVDMVFTDPPYNVDYSECFDRIEKTLKKKRKTRINQIIKNDKMSDKDFFNFLVKAFDIKHILNTYNSYYIFCSSSYIDIFIQALKKNRFIYTSLINWVKNKPVLTFADYLYKHEPILYGWYNRHRFYKKGYTNSTVWIYDNYNKNDLHPTMKPIELIVNAILNSTLENMIVYDCFLGSGSTLIACEHTKRKCYGMEIDEHYCGVIIERWQKYTNKKAIKLN